MQPRDPKKVAEFDYSKRGICETVEAGQARADQSRHLLGI